MISTDFAPNESWYDAWISLKLLLQSWRWRNGPELNEIKKRILYLLRISNFEFRIYTFLTGRSALFHLLKALDLPKNSEVLIQAFTCEAVVLPILANDAKPVYVDIETKSYSMDPIDLQKKITINSKVLILQHTFGLTPDRKREIVSLVKKHKLVLIEDIAHGTTISNFKFQISNSFLLMSFGRSKAVSSVFGGAIVTSDRRINAKLHNYLQKILVPSFGFMIRLLFYKPLAVFIKTTYDFLIGKYIHYIVTKLQILTPEISQKEKNGQYDVILDKAYPNGLAILLDHQLKKYEQVQNNRALICDFYQNSLQKQWKLEIGNWKLPLIRFPLLMNNRDQFIKSAAKQNIYLGTWYDQVVAPKSVNLSKMKYKQGSCPVAEDACNKIINLPTLISQNDAQKIVTMLSDYGN